MSPPCARSAEAAAGKVGGQLPLLLPDGRGRGRPTGRGRGPGPGGGQGRVGGRAGVRSPEGAGPGWGRRPGRGRGRVGGAGPRRGPGSRGGPPSAAPSPLCPQPVGALLLERCRVTQEEPSGFSISECRPRACPSRAPPPRLSARRQSPLPRAAGGRAGLFPRGVTAASCSRRCPRTLSCWGALHCSGARPGSGAGEDPPGRPESVESAEEGGVCAGFLVWRSNERNVCSPSPGGQKSDNRVSAGVVPCQGNFPRRSWLPGVASSPRCPLPL